MIIKLGGWHNKHPYVYVRGLIAGEHMQGLYDNNICSSVFRNECSFFLILMYGHKLAHLLHPKAMPRMSGVGKTNLHTTIPTS